MLYRNLGRSGLRVSPLCLGSMNFGGPTDEPTAQRIIGRARDAGVNFIDTYFRTGMYPHSLPFILGCEVCGIVEALGDGVTGFSVGQRVATADTDGTYAEYCVANVDLTAHVPDGVSPEVAASSLLKGETSHLLINSVYAVKPGDRVHRYLAGVIRLPMTVTAVDDERIHCGDWTFCRVTGAEVDERLGWGPAGTGSYITAEPE